MNRTAVCIFVTLTILAAGLNAQDVQPRLTEADQLRGRVADALAKGGAGAAEKLLADPGVAKLASGGLTTYEQIRSCGFYPQETRLECVLEIKQPFGYGGPIGSFGSFEFVAFYIDWRGDGFQLSDYVGSGIVHITDGSGKTNFAVYRDFNPPGGPRTANAGATAPTTTTGPILRARAILQWAVPTTGPNQIPFWGNVFDFQIRLMPIR